MRNRAMDIVRGAPDAFLKHMNLDDSYQEWQEVNKPSFIESALAAAKNGPDALVNELKKWDKEVIHDSQLIKKMIEQHTESDTFYPFHRVFRYYLISDNQLPSLLKVLVAQGVSLQGKSEGQAPLLLALQHERFRTFEYLVQQPEAKDLVQAALETAVASYKPYNGNFQDVEKVIMTLLEKKADINKRNKYGSTLLFVANERESPDLTDLLLSQGADLFALRGGQLTILGEAYNRYLSSMHSFEKGRDWTSNELRFKRQEVEMDSNWRKAAYESADAYLKYLIRTIKKYLVTEGVKKDPKELVSFLKQSIERLAGKSENTDKLKAYLDKEMDLKELTNSIEKERRGDDAEMRVTRRPF